MSIDKYEGWTETEISREEFYSVEHRPWGPHLRHERIFTCSDESANRYYRLDPPAPKYREGEMRQWRPDDTNPDEVHVVTYKGGHWRYGNGVISSTCDRGEGTLSDPVVVVPAPSDEERAGLVTLGGPEEFGLPETKWLAKAAQALREQEATR